MQEPTWCDYEVSDEKLVALYGKGKTLQWDAARALDWSRPVDPGAPVHSEAFPLFALPLFKRLSEAQRETLTAAFLRNVLSQFLHGEQGALMAASKLVVLCPDYEAKLYSATQAMDEARHVEVFDRYVTRCGHREPAAPATRRFLDKVLGADSWLKLLIGMQIIVEGAALASLHAYREQTRDPLLADLLDGVIRDEARHVGFGTLYLRRTAAHMHDDDRESLAEFAYDAVMSFADGQRESLRTGAAALAAVGISPGDVLRDGAEWLKAGNAPRRDPSKDGITDFILPTLRRIGLFTARIEEKFAHARIHPSVTSPLIEQLDAIMKEQEQT